MSKKPNGYWAYERCKEKALEFISRSEFQSKGSSSHNVIRSNK